MSGANHHPTDGNQLINILRVQLPHIPSTFHIESTDLSHTLVSHAHFPTDHTHLYLMLQDCVRVELEEDLIGGHV